MSPNSGCRCSPDSSTTNESSPLRMAANLAVGSRKSATSVSSILPRSPWLLCRRRRAATNSRAKKARITATGTHQLAATQSIQDDSADGAGFFCATGGGVWTGTGLDVTAAGGGSGVAVAVGAAGGGCAVLVDGAGAGAAGAGLGGAAGAGV